jgi:multiple sugar transport system substrate-binding protein
VQNNLLLDLSNRLDWNNIEPWAKQAWTFGTGTYGLPLEAITVELYYNTKLMQDLGFTVPENYQFDQKTFLALVKAAREKGITPISLGVGDRPHPGAYLSEEALLKELGITDYGKLLGGELKWSDPRVVKALTYVKSLIDAGALPKSFSTLKLGESHAYFYSKPGSLMFLMGSFYPSRAFNPPDQGGQPPNFPLGIMQYPALDGAACNECKTMSVGGSYVVNAATKQPELAVAFLRTMATPAMGKLWVETVMGQTGIKTEMTNIGGPHAEYFKKLAAVNEHVKYFFGLPIQVMQGARRDAFTQIINQAFPAGLLSVQQVVDRMDAVK